MTNPCCERCVKAHQLAINQPNLLFACHCPCHKSAPTDTSEEWKGRFDAFLETTNIGGQKARGAIKDFIEKELERTKQRSFEEGQKSTSGRVASFQKGFEEGAKQIEHCAEVDCPECNHAAYKAGHAAALSKVEEFAEYEKLLDHNNRDYMKGYNAALADLLDHLKTIE